MQLSDKGTARPLLTQYQAPMNVRLNSMGRTPQYSWNGQPPRNPSPPGMGGVASAVFMRPQEVQNMKSFAAGTGQFAKK